MRYRLKKNPNDWKKYLISLTVMLSMVVGLLFWKSFITWPAACISWSLIALLLIFGLFSNSVSGAVYRGAMAVGYRLGQIFGSVFLFLFFTFLIIPLGLCLRLIGKDLLRFKEFKNVSIKTYWVASKKPETLDQMH